MSLRLIQRRQSALAQYRARMAVVQPMEHRGRLRWVYPEGCFP